MYILNHITKTVTWFWTFLVWSSTNQGKISSSLKAASVLIIPFLMAYYGLDQSTATQVISDTLTALSLLASLIFTLRKIVLTVLGENVAFE